MKLLVVSDTHGDTRALFQAVRREGDADAVFFLGDGTRDVDELRDERPSLRLYAVRGNCDFASFDPIDGLAAFGGVLFYYTHGHLYGVKSGLDALAEAARARGADAALYGHTHLPLLTRVGGVTLFNPGALSRAGERGGYGVVTIEGGAPSFSHRQLSRGAAGETAGAYP